MLTLTAEIQAPQLSPQDYEHLKIVLEKELSRNGTVVKITGQL